MIGFLYKKPLRTIMKISIMQLLIALVFMGITKANITRAQEVLDQRISLQSSNETFKKLLTTIERNAHVKFVYNPQDIRNVQPLSLDIKNERLSEVLDKILIPLNISYEVSGKQIALFRKTSISVLEVKPILNTYPENESSDQLITGKVVDEKGDAMPGVNILLKGTLKGTVSDGNGQFKLSIPSKEAILIVSFVGYEKQEISVGNKTSLLITLKAYINAMDEVIVLGYGTQKKINMTGAVSTMNSKEIQLIPASNLSNVLAGRMSGTFISSQTGTPGISSGIKIRGRSSFSTPPGYNPGDPAGEAIATSPIYVIDGVVRDKVSFDALSPNEVADVSILKDAASAAIYGSRSSNGVILVRTKTGSTGKPSISFSSLTSVQTTGVLPQFLSLDESVKLHRAVNGAGSITNEELNYVKATNPQGLNFYNDAYRNPKNQQINLSASGGTDKIKYFLGTSYFNESGFLPNVNYQKYNLRGNISAELVKNLTVGLNLNTSTGTRERFNFTYDYGSDDLNNLWGKLLYMGTNVPSYIDGKPVNPGWLGNVIEMMKNGGYWRNENQQIDALITAEYKVPFIKGLALKSWYSQNTNNSFVKTFAKKQLLYNFKTTGANNLIYTNELVSPTPVLSGDPGQEYVGNEYTKANSYQFDMQVAYDTTFGKHTIGVQGIYEQYEYQSNFFSAYRYNFPAFTTDQFFAASGNNADWKNDGKEVQDGRLSYIGRLNYEYDQRYLFSASVRRDGSVKFAPDKRWGWFPSVSAGWVISNENFFKAMASKSIDFLKLRASYATTGNDIIGGWQWLDQYNIDKKSYYYGNGVTGPRLTYGGIPNPNLTWEKSQSLNVGLDMGLFRNINLTLEYWQRHTYDILGNRILAVPTEFGGSLPAENYGIMNSNGIEIELGYKNTVGKNFRYEIKGNFNYATNTVIKQDVAANTQPFQDPNGKPYGYLYGYNAMGVIKNQADLDKLPKGYTINGVAPQLGDMLLQDVSGPNGVPDNKVDQYDQVVLSKYNGASNAPISYGISVNLSYKNFSIETLFAGLAGFTVTYNDAWGRNFGGGFRVPKYYENAWSPENPNGTAPAPQPWGNAHAAGYQWTSSYNTYNGSFLRMKYLNLNYRLPSQFSQKLRAKDIRIFLSGTNLFNITEFKFFDPEVYQFMSYPVMKTFSAGLSINF